MANMMARTEALHGEVGTLRESTVGVVGRIEKESGIFSEKAASAMRQLDFGHWGDHGHPITTPCFKDASPRIAAQARNLVLLAALNFSKGVTGAGAYRFGLPFVIDKLIDKFCNVETLSVLATASKPDALPSVGAVSLARRPALGRWAVSACYNI